MKEKPNRQPIMQPNRHPEINTKGQPYRQPNRQPNRRHRKKVTEEEKNRIELIKKALGGFLFLTIVVFVFVYAIVGALKCPDGYTGLGTHCNDIDECTSNKTRHNCSSTATCRNKGKF